MKKKSASCKSFKEDLEKRLLNELWVKKKLEDLSPDVPHTFLSETKNPLLSLEIALETLDFYGSKVINSLPHLCDLEIKNTMVGSFIYNKDGPGFLHVRINPKISRELIHYLIDKELDNHPKEIFFHYMSDKRENPGLKLKDFLKHHYPNYTEEEIKATFDPDKKGKNDKRFRHERIRALKVWEERRLRKPFKQIAKELNIREPACKKMFYKAYVLLYGKKYNPAYYEKPKIKKEYLKRECKTCEKKPTCESLCPDVIAFVEQDTKPYLREYLFNTYQTT